MRLFFTLLLVLAPLPVTAADDAPVGLPDFSALAERLSPVVVNISSTQRIELAPQERSMLPEQLPFDEMPDRFREPDPELFDSDSLGSGVLISGDGEILTNYHVIKGAREIVVRLADGRQLNAQMIGADSASDLALLKIDARDLPVAKIGDADRLRVGEWVMAIGSPFGFDYSVTSGIVSAKGRSVGTERYVPYIQTDVAINPGNSGGPLFNLDGEVVGINSQIYSRTGGFMGVSFAIPINLVMDVAEQLRRNGRVSRGWLGVDIQDVTREQAKAFGLSRPEGALVRAVLPDSPAERAGVQVSDVILAFEERAITAADILPPLVGSSAVGSRVRLSVLRDGERQELEVVLGELPPEAMPATTVPAEIDGPLGLGVREMRFGEREQLGLEEDGVVIDSVLGGPARDAGLRAGDVILAIDHQDVESMQDFNAAVARFPRDRYVAILVHRNGSSVYIPLRVQEG